MGRFAGGVAAVLAAGVVAGCASVDADRGSLGVYDPYENTNRQIHAINKSTDQYFLRPIASVYDDVTPEPARFLISNALDHLELPRDFVSHLFSGEIESAGRTVLRFGVNTVVGAGGFLDPATDFELPKEDADFDVALAAWGLEEGAYIELLFFGPSTVRHTAGRVVDMFLAPTTYVGDAISGPATSALSVVEFRADNFSLIDEVYYDSADSYIRAQSVYVQNRRRLIDGEVSLDDALPLEGE